ncbi:MAG TPA: aldo/keto reductase [Candidatus Dojkabacteria bacterium]|jgi:aryl-alcohol dehydrogenase-like predicted oxidoreductase
MKYRILGKTGYKVSEVSFGAWAIGGSWGKVNDKESLAALERGIELGINFIDTADVYGDGRSEKVISKLLKSKKDKIYVATKAGRRLDPHVAEGYTIKNIEKFIDRSLKNLQVDKLDLLQLHCPPTQVFYIPELFEGLENLKKKGKIAHFGVSVEKVEEAIKAIEYPGVATVQIIFNIFRQRPKELFFKLAKRKNVGIIARVPYASGLLTGRMSIDSKFEKEDHRNFNRHGEAFDVGETFAGVDFDEGIKAITKLKKIKPKNISMAQMALKWILMHPEVSCAIPGARNIEQIESNTSASKIAKLNAQTLKKIELIYNSQIKKLVHQRW